MKPGILIGQLSDTRNEAALIRTAEALGVGQVHLVEEAETHISTSVTRGADQHVSIHHHDTYRDFVGKARDNNQHVVAIENSPGAVPVEGDVDYPVNPIFVTGNEGQGVPAQVMDGADLVVKITQSPNGYIRCLNTTVSGSIVIHDWFATRLNRDHRQHDFTER